MDALSASSSSTSTRPLDNDGVEVPKLDVFTSTFHTVDADGGRSIAGIDGSEVRQPHDESDEMIPCSHKLNGYPQLLSAAENRRSRTHHNFGTSPPFSLSAEIGELPDTVPIHPRALCGTPLIFCSASGEDKRIYIVSVSHLLEDRCTDTTAEANASDVKEYTLTDHSDVNITMKNFQAESERFEVKPQFCKWTNCLPVPERSTGITHPWAMDLLVGSIRAPVKNLQQLLRIVCPSIGCRKHCLRVRSVVKVEDYHNAKKMLENKHLYYGAANMAKGCIIKADDFALQFKKVEHLFDATCAFQAKFDAPLMHGQSGSMVYVETDVEGTVDIVGIVAHRLKDDDGFYTIAVILPLFPMLKYLTTNEQDWKDGSFYTPLEYHRQQTMHRTNGPVNTDASSSSSSSLRPFDNDAVEVPRLDAFTSTFHTVDADGGRSIAGNNGLEVTQPNDEPEKMIACSDDRKISECTAEQNNRLHGNGIVPPYILRARVGDGVDVNALCGTALRFCNEAGEHNSKLYLFSICKLLESCCIETPTGANAKTAVNAYMLANPQEVRRLTMKNCQPDSVPFDLTAEWGMWTNHMPVSDRSSGIAHPWAMDLLLTSINATAANPQQLSRVVCPSVGCSEHCLLVTGVCEVADYKGTMEKLKNKVLLFGGANMAKGRLIAGDSFELCFKDVYHSFDATCAFQARFDNPLMEEHCGSMIYVQTDADNEVNILGIVFDIGKDGDTGDYSIARIQPLSPLLSYLTNDLDQDNPQEWKGGKFYTPHEFHPNTFNVSGFP